MTVLERSWRAIWCWYSLVGSWGGCGSCGRARVEFAAHEMPGNRQIGRHSITMAASRGQRPPVKYGWYAYATGRCLVVGWGARVVGVRVRQLTAATPAGGRACTSQSRGPRSSVTCRAGSGMETRALSISVWSQVALCLRCPRYAGGRKRWPPGELAGPVDLRLERAWSVVEGTVGLGHIPGSSCATQSLLFPERMPPVFPGQSIQGFEQGRGTAQLAGWAAL